MLRIDVPLVPDPDEGRQWLIDELAKPEYQQAKPTLIDEVGRAIGDWLQSALGGAGGTPPVVGITIIAAAVVAVIVVILLVYGLPRRNRRGAATGELFGAEERRSAAELRSDAERAASRGEWAAATVDIYRAIARGLAERELVETLPGTTAHEFARRAGEAFPPSAEDLRAAASAFDDVRYLGAPGSAEEYRLIASLEQRLRAARPRPLVGAQAGA